MVREMEEDDEYEYEESTVMVELQGIMEQDCLSKVKEAKVLGIDTDRPLLQLDNFTFAGEYQDTLGTALFFEDVTDESASDDDPRHLTYYGMSNKKLAMQRVFLKRNEEDVEPGQSDATQTDSETAAEHSEKESQVAGNPESTTIHVTDSKDET